MTSSRSTPGFDPRCKRHYVITTFHSCSDDVFFCWFSPLSSAEASLCRKKKKARGTRWEGETEKRGLYPPFPSFHIPLGAFYFSIIAIFIGIPIGNLCGGEGFPLFPKTNTSKFQFNFWFLTLDVIADV